MADRTESVRPSVAPTQSCDVTVDFTPSQTGARTESLEPIYVKKDFTSRDEALACAAVKGPDYYVSGTTMKTIEPSEVSSSSGGSRPRTVIATTVYQVLERGLPICMNETRYSSCPTQ